MEAVDIFLDRLKTRPIVKADIEHAREAIRRDLYPLSTA